MRIALNQAVDKSQIYQPTIPYDPTNHQLVDMVDEIPNGIFVMNWASQLLH